MDEARNRLASFPQTQNKNRLLLFHPVLGLQGQHQRLARAGRPRQENTWKVSADNLSLRTKCSSVQLSSEWYLGVRECPYALRRHPSLAEVCPARQVVLYIPVQGKTWGVTNE